MPTTEVFTNTMVQAHGRNIGRICTVWKDGFYVGSYFEQIVEIPENEVGNCRNLGLNGPLMSIRERDERDGPRELRSWLDSFARTQ